MGHPFTLGVEEEFQIVDPTTWELRSHVSELLASSAPAFGDQVKREMHQSIIEVGTRICAGVEELAGEIIRNRRDLADAAERVGLRVAAAGTHPFSNWMDQVLSPGERYQNIVEELQQLARSLLIFGLHVHVAVPDRSTMIDLMNEARYFLPHLTFGTLEFRICDVPTAPRESIAIAALAQAIIVKLYRLRARNLGFRLYHRALIEENKWRASRWGLDGKLIDFGRRAEVPMRDLAIELLEFVDDVVDELGSREATEYVRTILAEGTSADRQLAVYRQTGDLHEVVRRVVEETSAVGVSSR